MTEASQEFVVRFGEISRTLTRRQLEKAPDSLLSTVLLGDAFLATDESSTLVIPSRAETKGAGPHGSRDGTESLFQVTI